jgi:Fe-S-cluster containining protein
MQLPQNVTRLCGGKKFSFRCHPEVPCFTDCCRELELALTPYDVLCLSKELEMGGVEFLNRYVVVEQDKSGGFPRLYLGMVDDGRASCPFISEKGCAVYGSRPGACRAYPVGRGCALAADGKMHEIHVLVREDHCLGFEEPQSHNVAEWFENQGLTEYNRINDEVLTLLQHEKGRDIRLTGEQNDLYMLMLYKLDELRQVLAKTGSLAGISLNDEELSSVLADDVSLLRFGIRRLKDILFTTEL